MNTTLTHKKARRREIKLILKAFQDVLLDLSLCLLVETRTIFNMKIRRFAFSWIALSSSDNILPSHGFTRLGDESLSHRGQIQRTVQDIVVGANVQRKGRQCYHASRPKMWYWYKSLVDPLDMLIVRPKTWCFSKSSPSPRCSRLISPFDVCWQYPSHTNQNKTNIHQGERCLIETSPAGLSMALRRIIGDLR